MTTQNHDHKDQIFTIPNFMSVFRIALIPVYMFLFFNGHEVASLIVVGVSALTDVLDGFIARKFNMVSSLGKALDPIADKLSLFTLMLCLIFRFRPIIILAILIFAKEITQGIVGLIAVRRSGVVPSAGWHGKLTTAMLYATLMLHLLWKDIPETLTWILIGVCCVLMVTSLTLYILSFRKMIRESKEKKEDTAETEEQKETAGSAE